MRVSVKQDHFGVWLVPANKENWMIGRGDQKKSITRKVLHSAPKLIVMILHILACSLSKPRLSRNFV
ncbi:MAG TPA: hypothetical protein DCY34_11050 [Rhodobacteraceae bacterium]|nr:hypothetical protein [Paracoccaceae bacterium]